MLPQHYNRPGLQLELTEEEIERGVTNLTPNPQFTLKHRIMRGLNCCIFILKHLGYVPPKFMDHTYNEEFIEAQGSEGLISAKLIEPHLVCNIEAVYTLVNDQFKYFSRKQFLSEFVDSPWVIIFIQPIKDGHPAILPIYDTPTVEKDIVHGVFSCLRCMGFKFKGPLALRQLQNVRQKLTDGGQVMDYITYNLLPEKALG
jgi:hypothetical protein